MAISRLLLDPESLPPRLRDSERRPVPRDALDDSTYARWFNQFHELDGHLFQRRFHAVVVETDWHLMELSRYVSLNPVRAGLCPTPRDWKWSSYGAIVGEADVPPFLAPDLVLAHFGRDRERARRAFADFVREASLTAV